jgi:hypothetical protein
LCDFCTFFQSVLFFSNFLCVIFSDVNNSFENERLMISTGYFLKEENKFVLMFTFFAQENETKYM